MNKLLTLLKNEPAAIVGVIQATIVLIVLFGVDLTPEQQAAILSLAALVLGLVTRAFVSPASTTPKPPLAGMLAIALTVVACTSCTPRQMAAASDVIGSIARGSSWLASALDAGESGASRYFARHPNADREQDVSTALHRARLAQETLDGLLAAVSSVEDERLDHARAAALQAYGALRQLLDELGVLDAAAPDGGAEAEAPEPLPFALPTLEEMAARL